jgi:hypothetical protein
MEKISNVLRLSPQPPNTQTRKLCCGVYLLKIFGKMGRGGEASMIM